MKRLSALILLLLLVAIPVQAVTEHCPEGGTKTESQVDGDLDGIVLTAGILFCVKADGQASDVLTADGVQTLADYVTWLNEGGQTPNVSYYVIYTSTTSSTSTTGSTTTTSSTTTTTGSTTTTSTTTTQPTTTTPNETTTTASQTTTTVGETTTTAGVTTTTVGVRPPVPLTLPFTGFDPALFVGVALGLGSTGAYLIRRGRR